MGFSGKKCVVSAGSQVLAQRVVYLRQTIKHQLRVNAVYTPERWVTAPMPTDYPWPTSSFALRVLTSTIVSEELSRWLTTAPWPAPMTAASKDSDAMTACNK